MRAALETGEWDVILCDYSMPSFDALAALALVRDLKMDTPFIIISGSSARPRRSRQCAREPMTI